MEKKRLVNLLLISILLIVVSVFLTKGAVTYNSAGSSVSMAGGVPGSLANGASNGSVWTKGGAIENVTFVINFTGESITSLNITVPSDGYYLPTVFTGNDVNATQGFDANINFNWTFINYSASLLVIHNKSVALVAAGWNATSPLVITMNVTTKNNIEGAYLWNFSAATNQTNATTQFALFYTYVDGIRPRVTNINVTDGTTVLSASAGDLNSTKWLKNTSITIYATLTDHNFDEDNRPRFYYTTNGTAVNRSSPFYIMSSSNGSAYTYRLNLTIPAMNGEIDGVGNESKAFSFMIQVNDTYNHDYIYNTSAQSGFNFTIDGNTPTVTITPPTLTTISTSDSIKYTCSGGDADSGIKSYLWTITRPNDQVITKTTSAITLTGSDTSAAGVYDLYCKVTDNAENSVTSTTYQFTAHITSTGNSGSSGGGSSGTGSATAETVKVDKSITEIGASATITKSQGQSSTFSLDGKVSHTLKFKTVTSGSATVVIQSDPIEVTLNVGESKEVDVDGDGTNDLEVTLESVSSGAAKVTIKKIAETTAEVATAEPTTPTGEETTTTTPTEPTTTEKTSLVWLWIVIVVIVVIAIVVAFQSKRKK